MTFYQELQLNQGGSKALIRGTKDKKEKWRHIFIYNLKVYLTILFCLVFITLYTKLFGEKNSIAGVGVLLSVMAFRFVDLGFDIKHSMGVLIGLFAILAVGPHAANLVGPVPAFLINGICILMLTFFGCHNPLMSNHSILILSYLLLYGYDVHGSAYMARVLGLLAGGTLTAVILYRNHKKIHYKREFWNLFKEFRISSTRGRWQLQIAFAVSSAMLLGHFLGLQRVMWIGIAVMSVMQPFVKDLKTRSLHRMLGNVLGCLLAFLLYLLIPHEIFPMVGILGGICVGYCVTYFWQSAFNVLGALALAQGLFGIGGAMGIRVVDNLFGILYAVVIFYVFQAVISWISKRLTRASAVKVEEFNGA